MENPISLWIRHWTKGEQCDEHWNDTLASAREIVTRWVDDGMVDRVEIRDDNEKLLFHYPREMHGA